LVRLVSTRCASDGSRNCCAAAPSAEKPVGVSLVFFSPEKKKNSLSCRIGPPMRRPY
jgi:hypothetical protein